MVYNVLVMYPCISKPSTQVANKFFACFFKENKWPKRKCDLLQKFFRFDCTLLSENHKLLMLHCSFDSDYNVWKNQPHCLCFKTST